MTNVKEHKDARPLSWGIIGCGKHARRVMIPAMASSRLAKLHALASETPEHRVELTREYSNVSVYASYLELLADPEIDAVYIGLPNHLHAQWSIAALEAGKHVLCDKPMALTCEEVSKMHEASEENSKLLAEAFMYRFHPQYQIVRENIRDGYFGKLRLIEGHFHYALDDFSNIRWKKECGGGALYDVGCYIIDAAHFLLGERLQVLSVQATIHPEQGVDETIHAQLCSSSGVTVHLSASCRMPRRNTLSIFGSHGIAELDRAFIIPRNSAATICLQNDRSEKRSTQQVEPANQYSLELDAFSRKAQGLPVDESLFSDGRATLEVIEAIRQHFPL